MSLSTMRKGINICHNYELKSVTDGVQKAEYYSLLVPMFLSKEQCTVTCKEQCLERTIKQPKELDSYEILRFLRTWQCPTDK